MVDLPIGLGLVKSRSVVYMDTFTVTEFGYLDSKHSASTHPVGWVRET